MEEISIKEDQIYPNYEAALAAANTLIDKRIESLHKSIREAEQCKIENGRYFEDD